MTVRDEIVLKVLPFAEWMQYAACRGKALDIFFPDNKQGENYTNAAKSICSTCVHQSDCLEYALVNKIDDGVWGGTTREERRVILRKRRQARVLAVGTA